MTLDLTAKEVQLYLYGDKNGPYEIALIFDYPKDSKNSIDPKIRLSLEAFATGELCVASSRAVANLMVATKAGRRPSHLIT